MIDARQSEVRNALRVFSTLSRIATYRHGARVGEDSVSFDQVIAGAAGQVVLDLAPYRRCVGMPAGMRHSAGTSDQGSRTQHHSLIPKDLLIQVFGDTAVATFTLRKKECFVDEPSSS
jgi:hypothetical protein